MTRTKLSQGLSLLETVIALFILVSAFSIIASLFFRSNRALVQIEEKAVAVAFAETVLDDLRVWAQVPENFATGWSTRSEIELDEFPNYRARVTAVVPSTFTPCSQLETGKPGPQQRKMVSTFRDLELVVEHWDQEIVRFQTRIAEPNRNPGSIEVNLVSGSANLPAGATAQYEAKLLDDQGETIEDVSFHWTMMPDDKGNGTVKALSTNYAQCEVTNMFRRINGVNSPVPGSCRVVAIARYRGQELSGQSDLMEMEP